MTAPPPTADFTPATVQVKPWGHESIVAAGEHGYVGKLLTVHAGEALSLQYHESKDETMVVLTGEALVEHGPAPDDLARRTLRPGDRVHLPAGVLHRVTAVTELVIAEVSTAAPGWRQDVVRLDDRYGRLGTTAP